MNASQLLPTKLGMLHFINKYMSYSTLGNVSNVVIEDPKQMSYGFVVLWYYKSESYRKKPCIHQKSHLIDIILFLVGTGIYWA